MFAVKIYLEVYLNVLETILKKLIFFLHQFIVDDVFNT